jgi:hypothetical protein
MLALLLNPHSLKHDKISPHNIEQIEWENILSTYNAAFSLVRISEIFFLALRKSTWIESFFQIRTSGPLALLRANRLEFERIQ